MSFIDSSPSRNSTSRNWYLVYTKARQEEIAKMNLERQNYRVYLPRIEISVRKGTEIRGRVEAFFPRYLFINLDKQEDNWAPIRSTKGVCSLVRYGGVPRPVPADLISELIKNENGKHLQQVKRKSWQSGERILIEQGPFAGYSCIFQETKGIDRVAVLLDIIGKQTLSILPKNDLEIPQFAI